MEYCDAQEAALLRPAVEEADTRPNVPIETRTVVIIGIALIIVPFVLYAGAAFFIPLFVSLFLSHALSPVVDWMERCGMPRAAGAAVTMLLVTAVSVLGVQRALNGATEVLEELPQAVQKLRYAVTSWERDGKGALKQVQKTADELQKLAGASTTPAGGATVSAPAATPEPKAMVLAGTVRMTVFIGQLVSVLFLTYFLLAVGDLFRRRLMQVMGPSVAVRKKALQILQQVHALSRRYLALVLAMNIAVGLVTAAGLYALGVRHAGFWGIVMAVLHTIPYLGAAAVAAATGLIAYLQFGNATQALAAAAIPLGAATLIGIWLQTALMGRAGRLNAVVVFVALLFFGMVWGGWGLLLAFPVMATVRIVFGEIDRLKPVALLMGD
jgi:predicted PurR-regulated permease PerM